MSKKIITLFVALITSMNVWAQAPQKMSYQAVIRNNSGALVKSTPVGMRISIIQSTIFGASVYVETQTVNSNANGLVSLQIGAGTPITGTFASIDWANGPYFIKTETDPTGGTTYNITGTSELLSVPYALSSADNKWTSTGTNIANNNSGNVGIGVTVPNEKLEVAGKTKTTNLQVTSGAATGKVLTSDAVGNASWENSNAGWGLMGNSALDPLTNFIGTTDNVDIIFKRNGVVSGEIKSTDVSFGTGARSDGGFGVSIGYNSQINAFNTSFFGNTTIGAYTLSNYGFGDNNTAIGYGALNNCKTSNNTAIGAAALSKLEGNNSVAGWNNIGIGYNAQVPDSNESYQMSIGNVIYGINMDFNPKIGINTATPSTTLDIAGKTKTTDLQVTSGAATGKVLTSDAAGNATWQTAGPPAHYIGESYGGGIVFYVYDGGQHGLIAATADQSMGISWYGGSHTFTRARGDGVGAGLKNTAIIIANQGPVNGSPFAATVCNEYSVTVGGITYGDWYLPSAYELNLLYLQKTVVGGFAANDYWSSTEVDSFIAFTQNFSNGILAYNGKGLATYVRAIRAF